MKTYPDFGGVEEYKAAQRNFWLYKADCAKRRGLPIPKKPKFLVTPGDQTTERDKQRKEAPCSVCGQVYTFHRCSLYFAEKEGRGIKCKACVKATRSEVTSKALRGKKYNKEAKSYSEASSSSSSSSSSKQMEGSSPHHSSSSK